MDGSQNCALLRMFSFLVSIWRWFRILFCVGSGLVVFCPEVFFVRRSVMVPDAANCSSIVGACVY